MNSPEWVKYGLTDKTASLILYSNILSTSKPQSGKGKRTGIELKTAHSIV
jgi:hypothetical protein